MVSKSLYFKFILPFKDKEVIKVFTGIRRCGKSVLMEQFRNFLQKSGVSGDSIIFYNLEDLENEALLDYKVLYKTIADRLKPDRKNYVFLDEVQNCPGFERALDSLFIKKNVDLYVTGSNSKMLSHELATLLSGRYVQIEVQPFSFAEYIEGVKENFPEAKELSVQEYYQNYVRYGSFPFTVQLSDERSIYQYLDGVYHTIFMKDIIDRYQIKDARLLEDLLRFFMANLANIASSKKISDTLNSAGRKTSQPTVDLYMDYLAQTYLIYPVQRYDIRGKEYLKTLPKYYVCDPGMRNAMLGYKNIDTGHILENLVFLELRRRGYKVFTGKLGEMEIDFVAQNENGTIYIQVAESIQNEETLQREIKPFKYINDFYPRILLTSDFNPNKDINGIKIVNAFDFLKGGEI